MTRSTFLQLPLRITHKVVVEKFHDKLLLNIQLQMLNTALVLHLQDNSYWQLSKQLSN